MDQSAIQKVVDENIRLMYWASQLQDWQFIVDYSPEQRYKASAKVDPDYQTAEFNFDPAKHEDGPDVLDSLRHELAHVLAAPFILYEGAVQGCASDEQIPALSRLFTHALERHCSGIEAMLDHGLRLRPDAMLRRARRHLKEWQP